MSLISIAPVGCDFLKGCKNTVFRVEITIKNEDKACEKPTNRINQNIPILAQQPNEN